MQIARNLAGPAAQITDRAQLSNFACQPVQASAVERLMVHFIFESIGILRRDAVVAGPGVLNDFFHSSRTIFPAVPSILTRCPSFNRLVAWWTPTTAGIPYSRATTEP